MELTGIRARFVAGSPGPPQLTLYVALSYQKIEIMFKKRHPSHKRRHRRSCVGSLGVSRKNYFTDTNCETLGYFNSVKVTLNLS